VQSGGRLGIPIIGNLGVLKRCRELGLIDQAGPLIKGMRANGIRFGEALIVRFLRKLGENGC
jgi:predicted nucleic acid-binding protein